MKSMYDYYDLRDELYGLGDFVKLRNFPRVLFYMILYIVLFIIAIAVCVHPATSTNVMIGILIGFLGLTIILCIRVSKLVNSKQHMKKLRELERKRYDEIEKIINKKFCLNDSPSMIDFLSEAIKGDMDKFRDKINVASAAIFVSSFISTSLKTVEAGLDYFIKSGDDKATALNTLIITVIIFAFVIFAILIANMKDSILKSKYQNKLYNLQFANNYLAEKKESVRSKNNIPIENATLVSFKSGDVEFIGYTINNQKNDNQKTSGNVKKKH